MAGWDDVSEEVAPAASAPSLLSPVPEARQQVALGSPAPQPPGKAATNNWDDVSTPVGSEEDQHLHTSVQAGTALMGMIPGGEKFIPMAEAYAQAVAHPYTGVGHPGETIGERYALNLPDAQARHANYERENPGEATTLKVGGGVLTASGLGMTKIGAKILGLTGKNLPQMMGRSALAAAAWSGGDTYLNTGDPQQALSSAEGAIPFGAAGPVVGAVASKLARGVRGLQPIPTEPSPLNYQEIMGVKVPISGGQATLSRPALEREAEALQGVHGEQSQKVMEGLISSQKEPVEQVANAIAGKMSPNGQIRAMTGNEAGQVIGEAIKDKAAASKQNYDALYDQFRQSQGQFAPFSSLGDGIKSSLPQGWGDVLQEPALVPASSGMISQLNRISGRSLTTSEIDVIGKNLRRFADTAKNPTDAALSGMINHGFNDAIDQAMSSGRYQGDPNAIQAWRNAKAAFAQHQQLFNTDDAAGKMIRGILDPKQASSENEVARALYGNAGGSPVATKNTLGVVQRMKDIFGEGSPEFSAIGQGAFGRMLEGEAGPQKVQKAMNKYLQDNSQIAKAIHGHVPEVLPAMEQYSALMGTLKPQFGGIRSTSGSGEVAARVISEPIKRHLIPAMVGIMGAAAHGPVGAVVGAGLAELVDRAVGGIPQRLAARETRRVTFGRPGQTSWRQAGRQAGTVTGIGSAPTMTERERQDRIAKTAELRRQAQARSLAR